MISISREGNPAITFFQCFFIIIGRNFVEYYKKLSFLIMNLLIYNVKKKTPAFPDFFLNNAGI